MSKVKMKYYLSYAERCSPKMKQFNTLEELYKFMAEFSLTMYDNPDNSIEYAFKGDILMKSEEFRLE